MLDEDDSKNFVLFEVRFVLLTGDDVASVDVAADVVATDDPLRQEPRGSTADAVLDVVADFVAYSFERSPIQVTADWSADVAP